MTSDYPAYLLPGDKLGARGVFYEAEVQEVERKVFCKVLIEGKSKVVPMTQLAAPSLQAGKKAKFLPVFGLFKDCQVLSVTDKSIYTVAFEDGVTIKVPRSRLAKTVVNRDVSARGNSSVTVYKKWDNEEEESKQ